MIKKIKKESDAPFSLLYKHGFFLTSLELKSDLKKIVREFITLFLMKESQN